ncbi:MAG: M1 family metallopeptidase [Myxococcota bacterium]|nr:M1 family metallopeptidase [Myxococcota bacterium]
MAQRKKGTKVAGKRKATARRKKTTARSGASMKKVASKKVTSRKKAASKKATSRKKAAGKKAAASKKAASKKAAAAPPKIRPYRLPKDVRPLDVDVTLTVDPAKTERFEGRVAHHLTLDRRRRDLWIHSADLRVARAVVRYPGGSFKGRIEAHPEREALRIVLPQSIPAGEATLEMGFRGKLRRDLRGLYAATSGSRRYAFTQLEAADARRFFPCFDEPAMKARFKLAVTTAKAHTVLSNQPVQKVEPLAGGQKTVHFERTPKLSTYLLALGVGELEASAATHCGDTEIRVWHVPGKSDLTAFALETARETLARLERYFDLPYPYAKLDLVAVPDFEAGAMENAGAVFFRETLLLVDPETATLQEKKRVAEVVCHELAHMWYGDLVTMAWWDDLWLNEAFATWMAFHVVDAWRPEWKMWNDFQHYRSAALGMDALENTHPIYNTVRTAQEATENFDLITYEKGASVVRMIERYLGAETFRAGVRAYIREHQESNTVAADLWSALSKVSKQDVESIVRPWIEQSGFPLLRLRRGTRAGETVLRYDQSRFRLGDRTGDQPATDQRWPIPWVGRIGTGGRRTRAERRLLTASRGTIPLGSKAPKTIYGNADEGGFFRPLHDEAEIAALSANLGALTPVERMGLVGHQWAATRAGRAGLDTFLDLAMACGGERDPDVLVSLRGPLASAVRSARVALGEESAKKLRGHIAGVFGPELRSLGFDRAAKEDDEVRLRRAALLALVGLVSEDDDASEQAATRCRAYLDDRASLDPNLADTVVALGARRGDAALFDRFLAEADAAKTPQEQRRFLMAVADFRQPKEMERSLALLLDERVGTQDVAILLTRLLGNEAARERTWEFMKARWTALKKRMPPMLVTRPIDALPALRTAAHRRDVARFFRQNPVATGARAVKQALEEFDLLLAFDERARPALRRWLSR